MNNPISLAGLNAAEISRQIPPAKGYRGKQILSWIVRGAVSFDEMTDLPGDLRNELKTSAVILSSSLIKDETGSDGTSKILIRLEDGGLIEAVLLEDEKGRKTACISSQAGCDMGCRFCRTGTMGLIRNLTAGEIIEQYMHLSRLYGRISNIVYMGMGEPLENTEALIKSIKLFTDPSAYALSPRRITVSTCGLAEGILKLSNEEPRARLAVSLVSADEEIRTSLMPVNRICGLDELKKALISHQAAAGRRITLECVLMMGINDSPGDAGLVADWAGGLKVNVNVIPWNPAAGMDFEEPDHRRVEAYCRALEARGIGVIRRYRRGRGLNAACGQLAAESRPAAGN